MGLRSDGTVLVTGNNEYGQCNVQNWKNDVIAIATARKITAGLRSDGTVLVDGFNCRGQIAYPDWTEIVGIWVCEDRVAALRKDGTLLCMDPVKLKWFRETLGEKKTASAKKGLFGFF